MDTDMDHNSLDKDDINNSVNKIIDNLENDSGEEDDNPIVERIPVFTANSLNAFLLQYPVRPATMPYDGAQVQKLLFRPNHNQVEMHIGLDTNNDNYDESHGEQIALNVDGAKGDRNSDAVFKSGKMDVQVLNGGKAVEDSRKYAVGVFKDNKLHLTQVKGVITMRPNLGYLDKSDKRAKIEGRLTDPDDPEPEPKLEAVTVKFSKGEAEKQRKEKSYQSIKSKEQEEPWINLRFNQMKSARGQDERQNLICDDMDKKLQVDIQPKQYLNKLK